MLNTKPAGFNSDNLVQAIPYFLLAALATIHFSPALSSIFLGCALATGLFVNVVGRKFAFHNIPGWLWVLPLIYITQLAIQLAFHHQQATADKLLLKLPLFLIPLIAPYLSARVEKKAIWLNFVLLPLTWIGVSSCVYYFSNFRFFNQMILESKPLPLFSSVYHIEFSLLMSVACLLGAMTIVNQAKFRTFSFSGWLLIVTTTICILCLHILSARTGILAFWVGLTGYMTLKYGRSLWKMKVLWLAVAVMTVAVFMVPGIRNRIVNTFQDAKAVVGGADLNNKSFGQRIEAWKAAVFSVKQHPLTGVGYIGVRAQMDSAYTANHSSLREVNRVMPHNQYLDTAMQSGLVSGLLLLIFLIWSGYSGITGHKPELTAVVICFAASFMFESILERQAGILIFVFGIAWVASLDAGNGAVKHKINQIE